MSHSVTSSPAHAEHASYVFLLDETGEIHPLPHDLYVALARAEAASASLADKTFRLADWYVRLRDGVPEQVVNEWYGWIRFDAEGRFLPNPEQRAGVPAGSRQGEIDPSALPTAAERDRLEALLFGGRSCVGRTGIAQP